MIPFKPTADINELVDPLITACTWEVRPCNSAWYGYTIRVEPEDAGRELEKSGTADDRPNAPGRHHAEG